MSPDLDAFRAGYRDAFRSYLNGGGETGLESAYELGRAAVTGELSLLELARIHHEVLAESLASSAPGELARVARAGTDFFLESLSSFEMIRRGFGEAQETARLQQRHADQLRGLYERERGIARTLQDNLLPDEPPEIPGVTTCWRYVAGGDGVDVGGDWYEVLPLPAGRVGVAIGDVVGRGVGAAATMGHLRIALRAYALEDESPAHVARRTARFLRTLDRDQMSTCLYAVFDPATGELSSANAGHPPPLVVSSDGRAGFLAGKPGLPFGVADEAEYTEARGRLEPGAMLLLYTDGLVEKRGESIDAGLERLRAAAEGAPADADALCDRVLQALGAEGRGDDVAVLAVRYVPREAAG
jgi:serine phosphatase RsbU (regulator of sigma subunit)